MTAILLAAPLLPTPIGPTAFRVAAYATHALWFTMLVAFATAIASCWNAPLRRLVLALFLSLAAAVACIALDVDVASDIAKAAFGAVAGTLFVHAIERPWWLLPIAVCVPLADAWSVYSSRGVTNAIIERAQEEPRWIEWPTIASPIAGFPYELYGRLGIVDVLFTALFLGSAIRFELGVRRVAVALVLGLLATSMFVFEAVDIAVPALPMLCLAFLLAAGPALVRDLRAAARP
jgi:hypothetical protein